MKYANRHGYTDIHPYEIVTIISDKTMEVRAMDSTLDPTWKPEMVIGGFIAHTTNNNEQRWLYSTCEDAKVIRIRMNKKGEWRDKYKSLYVLSDEPCRFYDYNF